MSNYLLMALVGCIITICIFNQVAYGASSTTTISSSLNPSTVGQSVIFTASVSPNSATGTVQFVDTSGGATTIIGSAPVSSGNAVFQTSSLSLGSHSITANYLGDSNDAPSTSNILTQTIGQASLLNQQTAIQLVSQRAVTIDMLPRVATLVVDNTIYLPTDMPLNFNWQVGSKHTITISDKTVANGDGSRNLFYTWTDQVKDLSRTITVKDNQNFKALFKTQYYLTINSDYGNPKGEGWYDNNQVAQFSVSSTKVTDSDNLHRHIFGGWDGGDNKKSTKNSITIDKAIMINANWKDQYYIQLASSAPGTGIPGTGWYNSGDQVPLVADKEVATRSDEKYQFDKWVELGANPSPISSSDSNSAELTVNGPQTVQANWNKFYYVNVISPFGQASGGGFYQENATANISLSQSEITIEDKKSKVIFSGWSGDYIANGNYGNSFNSPQSNGVQSASPSASQSLSIVVTKPTTLVANWKSQYYLDVVSKQGTTSGSGWYDSGRSAPISVSQPAAPPGVWVKYVFNGWSGDSVPKSMDANVVMDGPKTLTAQWSTDSTPTIANSVIMLVIAGIGAFVYKKMKKKDAGKATQNSLVLPPAGRGEPMATSQIYQEPKTKKEYYQRYDVNPTEYQYYLFAPRRDARL